ncbi:MAG: LIC_13387 family protein [Myxococcaceae bacterium]
MKKPFKFLRAASVLSFLFFLGHSVGAPWTPSEGGATSTVIGLMKSYRFEVLGSERTYWDLYQGFGLTQSVFLLLEAVVLWFLATLAVKDAQRLRAIVVAYLVANVAQLFLVVRFFFLPPVVLTAAITLCLALALWSSRYAPTGPR